MPQTEKDAAMGDHVSLESKADAGDIEALCSLAYLYEVGIERPMDLKKSLEYLLKAASLGSALAKEKIETLLAQQKITEKWIDELKAGATEPAGGSVQSEKSKAAPNAPKIILADDEVELAEIMATFLQRAGFRTVIANNGDDAFKQVLAHPDVALIITDLKMPKVNGMQFIKTLRKTKMAENVKIVVVTAYSHPKIIEQCKNFGVSAWFVKPIPFDRFIETIKNLLEKKCNAA
jgi:CheY-like chemotaxis protein